MKRPAGVITHPSGFSAAGVSAGIKQAKGAPDVAVLFCEVPAVTAGVFTTNRVSAAPVTVSRQHLRASRGSIRAIVANSGNANACTGEQGMSDAVRMTELAAECLGIRPTEVLVASTGIIGHPLPMDRIAEGIAKACEKLSSDYRGGAEFLRGIMTTDIFPKEAEVEIAFAGKSVRVAGVAKGAGMIRPDLATMLSFVTTDAEIGRPLLKKLLKNAVARSFNRITVDGHMSTNDTCVAMASGLSKVRINPGSPLERKLAAALDEVLLQLALGVVRDGEGATRLVTVRVTGARSASGAERAARAVADSLLVKTAMFGADPNWGRIVSAAGASGCAFVEEKTSLKINGNDIYRRGVPLEASKALRQEMHGEEVTLDLHLGLGRASAVVYTCDVGYDYVKLNAEYHT